MNLLDTGFEVLMERQALQREREAMVMLREHQARQMQAEATRMHRIRCQSARPHMLPFGAGRAAHPAWAHPHERKVTPPPKPRARPGALSRILFRVALTLDASWIIRMMVA